MTNSFESMSFLKKIWQGWKIFARTLGRINSKILLTVFFFLILGPIALIRKIVFLFKPRPAHATFWLKKEIKEEKLEDFYRPF